MKNTSLTYYKIYTWGYNKKIYIQTVDKLTYARRSYLHSDPNRYCQALLLKTPPESGTRHCQKDQYRNTQLDMMVHDVPNIICSNKQDLITCTT